MGNRKNIWRWVLLYLVIIVTFLLFDLLFLDGAFRRDLIAGFVHEGMDQVEALHILGAPEYMFGRTSKFTLPFGNQMVIRVVGDGSVISSIESDPYFFQGILIPVIMAAVAVLEILGYLLFARHCKRRPKIRGKKGQVLRLILIYAFVIEVFLVCDLFFLGGVFCRDFMANFLYKGMDISLAYKLVGNPLRNVGSGFYVMEYLLPFGKRLCLSLHEVVLAVNPEDYFLRGAYLPIFMAVVAGLEATWYLLRARRTKRKAASACAAPDDMKKTETPE